MDKEKIQNLINQQRTTLAEVEYLDLDSIAKVVESFENPNDFGKKLLVESGKVQKIEKRTKRFELRKLRRSVCILIKEGIVTGEDLWCLLL